MTVTHHPIQHTRLSNWLEAHPTLAHFIGGDWLRRGRSRWQPLRPLRQWLDQLEIRTPRQAHRLCTLIPSQCPFARTVKLFGHTLLSIPPLCKLNPVYDELMMLRFRALSYLAEECGEDISPYC
ncbi:MAG: hypothetical protein HC838_04100 [Spirulinaceae cyanobacterium RM2_2_10]|nr:hypothetical protein [Spirulinaceae cyanobacterium SM2_1_0]NJO19410.1 hypothetical protein [Spirulinaceae cyanobacterium RM2_2_10]